MVPHTTRICNTPTPPHHACEQHFRSTPAAAACTALPVGLRPSTLPHRWTLRPLAYVAFWAPFPAAGPAADVAACSIISINGCDMKEAYLCTCKMKREVMAWRKCGGVKREEYDSLFARHSIATTHDVGMSSSDSVAAPASLFSRLLSISSISKRLNLHAMPVPNIARRL